MSFLEALVSVSEVDALALLGQLRGGKDIPSLLAVATQMPKVHQVQGIPAASQNQQLSNRSPVSTELEHLRNGSPVSLGTSASSSLPVFEPKIDMTPTPPDLFRFR
jgi:hypothetical protein